MAKGRQRRSGLRQILQRQGIRPWMAWAVVGLLLVFAGVMYWIDRGTPLAVPVPGNVQLPDSL